MPQGRSLRSLVRVVARLIAVFLAAATVAHAAEDLLRAAQANDATVALAAIEDGVDVNGKAPDGTTALHWAVYNGNAALVERLIAAGADVGAANEFGSTPLAEAATVGDAAIIEALLAAGADVDAPGADGQTALMVVARSGNTAAAQVLIAHGADVNARERWREQTALMWAAAQNQPAMVRAADRARRRGRRALRRQRLAAAGHGRAAPHVSAVRRADAATVRRARRLPRVRARARRGRREHRPAGSEGRHGAVSRDRQLPFRHGEDC